MEISPLPNSSSIEEIGSINVPAMEAFDLHEFFNRDNQVVQFGWIDEKNLQSFFPNPNIPDEEVHALAVSSFDDATEKKLLAIVPNKTTWADLKATLLGQPKGEDGDLKTDGNFNIFFIGDIIVSLRWISDNVEAGTGWYLNINPVSEKKAWHGRNQLIGRK